MNKEEKKENILRFGTEKKTKEVFGPSKWIKPVVFLN